jgi:hypothetical protein
MAGINLSDPRISQLLQNLLQRQQAQDPNPRSAFELAANLGATGIRQKQIKELREQEKKEFESQQDAMVKALQGSLPTKQTQLEGFDDVAAQDISIPGRRVGQQQAVGNLPIDQQAQIAQLLGMQKDLAEPGFREQREIIAANTPPEPPKTRTIKKDNDLITEQWDPRTGRQRDCCGAIVRTRCLTPAVTYSADPLPSLEEGGFLQEKNRGTACPCFPISISTTTNRWSMATTRPAA